MVRSISPIIRTDKQKATRFNRCPFSHSTIWQEHCSPDKSDNFANLRAAQFDAKVTMGHAVDPPAVTHFGQDNLDAAGPAIDLVAQDDLPPAESLKNDDDWVYPYPTDFQIQEHPIDEIRSLKVGIPA